MRLARQPHTVTTALPLFLILLLATAMSPAFGQGEAVGTGVSSATVPAEAAAETGAESGGLPAEEVGSIQAVQPPAPPLDVIARDTPSDSGGSVTVTWGKSADDGAGLGSVIGYEIFRAESPEGPFSSVGFASAGQTSYADPGVKDGDSSYYRVVAVSDGVGGESPVVGPAVSSAQWFNSNRWNTLVFAIILFGAIFYFIEAGRRGRKPFVRRIAGLDALEEAIGRATEMGRPILYVPGVHDMSEVQTVASMTILGHVARKTAAYETRLMVPNRFSLVMTTARETVKEACLTAGRPDAFREDDIFYISDEQFGYVAGVSGLIVRDKPAACLFLGAFFAESLILAETGNSIGAIQIAGTAQPAQLPFFVAACDYTLIGEELFAASAYLSGEPKQLGSLKGQDVGKVVAMAAIIIGSLLATAATFTQSPLVTGLLAGINRLFTNLG